jgi:transposase InsO family protein
LHAQERARAVLRGGVNGNVTSLPDFLKDYRVVRDAESGLASYFDFYNRERLHQSLQYQTPASVYYSSTR